MKPTTLLLVASLVANVALVGVFYSSRPSDSVAASSLASTKSVASSVSAEKSADRSSSSDAAALAAGQSPDAAREAALGRAIARFVEKMRAAQTAASSDGKWWRNRPNNSSREQSLLARRELSDAMVAAFGDDFGMGGTQQGQLSFLPADKRDALRNILQDYDEMMAKFGAQGGIQLASDKEKLRLLTAERDRDVAALLSPDELADYQMRTSASANTLRNRYGDGIASEDEFKKLYALQKAFDEKFPADAFNGRMTPDAMKARTDATLQLQSDMRAAVGDDAYAALKRASDSDIRTVDALVTRLNLPAETTDRVVASRDSYAAESQRIMADTATPFPQRREQLQTLAARAKADLTSALGAEAADAYAQRSPWMSMLQSGIGFSTTPSANSPGALSLSGSGGPSVYPVMPAGVGANGARQMVNVVSSTSTSSAAPTGTMFFNSDSGAVNARTVGTHMISVSSATTGDSHMMVADPNATTTIIRPPVSDTPPPVAPPKP